MEARRLRCWVEFVKSDGASRFKIGDAVTPSQLGELERNKDKPTQPWVKGEKLGACFGLVCPGMNVLSCVYRREEYDGDECFRV